MHIWTPHLFTCFQFIRWFSCQGSEHVSITNNIILKIEKLIYFNMLVFNVSCLMKQICVCVGGVGGWVCGCVCREGESESSITIQYICVYLIWHVTNTFPIIDSVSMLPFPFLSSMHFFIFLPSPFLASMHFSFCTKKNNLRKYFTFLRLSFTIWEVQRMHEAMPSGSRRKRYIPFS